MKFLKRLTSYFLCAMILLALLPFLGCEVDAATIPYSVVGGDLYFDPDTGRIMGCDRSVTAVNIPNQINGISVTSIGSDAFSHCTGLTSVTIPHSVTTIGERAFSNCTGLTGIWVDPGNPAYSSDNEGVLFHKDKTRLIQYPGGRNGKYSIPNTVTIIDYCAFFNCTGLTAVTIPDGVSTIGVGAFYGCTGLKSVTIPHSVTTIGSGAFEDCTGLTGVTIPYGVSAIDDWTFSGCVGLTSVTIPHSVTTIGNYVFLGCTGLMDVYYTGTEEMWNVVQIGSDNDLLLTAKMHYSNSSAENPFADVKERDYFYGPVLWAVEQGITNGTSPTGFSPDRTCTRGQIVTFLWRAAGRPEPSNKINPFTDIQEKDYFYEAVLWAVENGITAGTGKGKFSPEKECTRAQVATFLWRAQGEPAPTSTENTFNDVALGTYYYNAVLWAVEQGITNGTGKGKFSPENSCTRGQIVTFLYRALG